MRLLYASLCAGTILILGVLCAGCDPSLVIEAASLPAIVAADITPLAAQPNVTILAYKLFLDGVPAGVTLVSACPVAPAVCTVNVSIGTAGHHALAYAVEYLQLDVDPTSLVDSAPGPSIGFTINADPGAPSTAPKNVRKGS